MSYLRPAGAALIMLLAISCHNEAKRDVYTDEKVAQFMVDAEEQDYSSSNNKETGYNQQQPVDRGSDWHKKIIKQSTIRIEVENYQEYNKAVHDWIKNWEGYISSEEEKSFDNSIQNTLIIKVPTHFFDEAVQYISSYSGKLLEKQVSAKDVTSEYYDTKSRIEAKRKVRLRYMDMLQKAKNMEEVLQVEREINAIQEQIELGEGRVQFLNHSTAYSTLQLTFFQFLGGEPVKQPGYGDRVLLALADGAKWCGELLIMIVSLWPLLVGGCLVFLLIRRNFNSGRKIKPA